MQLCPVLLVRVEKLPMVANLLVTFVLSIVAAAIATFAMSRMYRG